jgi:hypothetical protein
MKRSLLLVVLAMPCWGSTIDQSFISGGGSLGTFINECCKFVAQTYTAGLTGTLAGIEIDVSSSLAFPLDVQIQSVAGGIPTGIILGDMTLGSSSSLLSSLITFPQLIPQVAGTQYAIVVDYPTAPFVVGGSGQGVGGWGGGTGNPYPGGQDLMFLGTSWTDGGGIGSAGFASHFQTFVTNTTPEPSTGVLVLTAGVIALMLRRKVGTRIL